MGRVNRGFRVLSVSWQVLKADRELMWLPFISFMMVAAMTAALFLPLLAGGDPPAPEELEARHFWLMGAFYFVATFITIFFNAAVVAAAMIRLEGGDPTASDGLRAAWSKAHKIFAWSLLTASIGLLLHALEERAGWLGRIVVWFVGAAWSAVTFFVVPVLLFENWGVTESISRSGDIFKERWGEQFTGNFSIGFIVFLFALPVLAVTALLWVTQPILAVIVGVLGVATISAGGAAMSGIFSAALYRFAKTGEASGGFSTDDLGAAFRERRRGLFG